MSSDYPKAILDATGEGEPTLGFSFGWAPGRPKNPIPAFFPSFSCLRNARIPLASAGRKSTGREEKLGLGSGAETKLCWCQAWNRLLPSRWGLRLCGFPCQNRPGTAPNSPQGGSTWIQLLPGRVGSHPGPAERGWLDLGSLGAGGAERDDEVSLQLSRVPKPSLKLQELGRV